MQIMVSTKSDAYRVGQQLYLLTMKNQHYALRNKLS